jgi:hypothetical protein
MTSASDAVVFGSWDNELEIPLGGDPAGYGLVKTGPSRPAFVLSFRIEKRQEASGTNISAFPLLLEQGAGKGTLGSFLEQDLVRLIVEQSTPFVFRFLEFLDPIPLFG